MQDLFEDLNVDGLQANVHVHYYVKSVSRLGRCQYDKHLQHAMAPVNRAKTLLTVCRLKGWIAWEIVEAEYWPNCEYT